jgi:hypothetical protein
VAVVSVTVIDLSSFVTSGIVRRLTVGRPPCPPDIAADLGPLARAVLRLALRPEGIALPHGLLDPHLAHGRLLAVRKGIPRKPRI